MRRRPRFPDLAGRVEWDAILTWAIGFGLVVLLGLEGGGFDPLVHDQVGIALWWVIAIGVLVGALPRLGPGRTAAVGLALFAAFVAWTALSLAWTESSERTVADLARVLSYLAILVLAVFLRAGSEPRRLLGALAAAIAVISLVALLSRLHPSWFPAAGETAGFLEGSRERLSYPLDYWNGLGALIAIGLPILIHVAATARAVAARALAAAALPALGLALFFTLSRGGIAAAGIALLAYLALAHDRVAKLPALVTGGLGAGLLIALAAERDALRHGLDTAAAHSEGDEMILIGLAVCAVVALIQVAIAIAGRGGRRPAWTVPSRAHSSLALGAVLVALVAGAVAVDAPGRASDAVDEFKSGDNAGFGTGRLNSFAGESRYALWRSAIDQNATEPLLGTGSGTFAYWWDRDAAGTEAVQDAHSLYLQTLGELGVVGLLILLAFVATVLAAGVLALLGSEPERRSTLAAALAASLAFLLTAAVDWSWQLPVLAAVFMLLAATLSMAPGDWPAARAALSRWPARLAIVAVAIVAIAVPLASTTLVRESRADVRAGDLEAALEKARSARRVEPAAATPRLQEALVLELQGELSPAASAAREATKREATNWRTWLVLSRIEAELGRTDRALSAYRRAKSLKPLSPLFERAEEEARSRR